MENSQIADIFQDIARILGQNKENVFKVRAYERAARLMREMPVPAAELVESGKLQEVPGIGKAIVAKTAELLSTGRLSYYEELKSRSSGQIGGD